MIEMQDTSPDGYDQKQSMDNADETNRQTYDRGDSTSPVISLEDSENTDQKEEESTAKKVCGWVKVCQI